MIKNRKKIWKIISLLVVVIFCMLISSCKKKYYQTSGEVFKTSFQIKYKYEQDLGDEIQACFDKFNLSLNPFNKQSIIAKVNNNEPVELDDWFITVFNRAGDVYKISGGTYDITCAPLVNLWGFGFSKMDAVNQSVIDSLMQFVGYKKIRIEGRKIVKDDPRIQLNASSIAKGYACDVVAQLLESHGIADYMVEIGGEIHAKGKNQHGECWQIQIREPLNETGVQKTALNEVVKLCDQSIATSGNYINYYIKDGKKIAHTINALTGYPAESNILSASVFYANCMTADAFATAFMTMDLENACKVGNMIPGLDYLFIYADENGELKERNSSGVDRYLLK
jgi:thiamine biosynthesis lipoprotein